MANENGVAAAELGEPEAAPAKLGFFGRLVARVVGAVATAPAVKKQASPALPVLPPGGAPPSVPEPVFASESESDALAWSSLLAKIDDIAWRRSGREGAQAQALGEACERWRGIAANEIDLLRSEVDQARAEGWGEAGRLPEMLRGAAGELARTSSTAEDASKVFGLGWTQAWLSSAGLWSGAGAGGEDGSYRAEPGGLQYFGGEAPERLAAWALAARSARRICAMSMGSYPAVAETWDAGGIQERMGFVSKGGVWARRASGVDEVLPSGCGTAYGKLDPGVSCEPSLGAMCEAFGPLAIEALRHGGGGSGGPGLVAEFARHWMARSGAVPMADALADGVWAMPNAAALESIRPRGGSAKMEEAAMAAGVPAWCLGQDAIPAERWMSEGVGRRIESAPAGYWGLEGEGRRADWLNVVAMERKRISEDELSASYSDDPRCRLSERVNCRLRSMEIATQEAFLDWAMRRDLPEGSPWAATSGCARSAASALRFFADEVGSLGGLSVLGGGFTALNGFHEAMVKAGWPDPGEGGARQIASRLDAWAEASDIGAQAGPGSRPGKPMRM